MRRISGARAKALRTGMSFVLMFAMAFGSVPTDGIAFAAIANSAKTPQTETKAETTTDSAAAATPVGTGVAATTPDNTGVTADTSTNPTADVAAESTKPKTVTVHLDANGGEGHMDDFKVTMNGDTWNIAENSFTRDSYRFIGWSIKADVAKDAVDDPETEIDESLTGVVLSNKQAFVDLESQKRDENGYVVETHDFGKYVSNDVLTLYAQWEKVDTDKEINAVDTPATSVPKTNTFVKKLTVPLAVSASSGNIAAVYRLYNPNGSHHLFTTGTTERDNLRNAGWTYDGIGWYAPTTGSPVYRLYNPYGGQHYFTASTAERDNLKNAGWLDEGVGFCTSNTKAVPIYRAEWSNGNNVFTATESEARTSGTYRGISFYGAGYYVSYNSNGGSSTPGKQTVAYGKDFQISSTKPSKAGWTFKDWGGHAAGSTAKNLTNTDGQTVTLKANYNPNSVKVTFNGNGGTISKNGTQTFTSGKGQKFADTGANRTGYTLLGWADSSSATKEQYSTLSGVADSWIGNGGSRTIYAVWRANSYSNTISHWTFGYKNGEGNNAGKTAFLLGNTTVVDTYGGNITLDSGKAMGVPNGFALRNKIGTSSIDGTWNNYTMPLATPQKASSMNFEYRYDPIEYKITYALDGGTNSTLNPSTYNVLYGVTFADPTKDGYTFDGWYDGTAKVTGINPGATANFSSADDLRTKVAARTVGDKTISAHWNANTYTVKYDGNGATSGDTESSTHTYDTAKALTTNGFSRTDYTFTGWNTKADGSGIAYSDKASVENLTATDGDTVTLYVQWKANTYTVDFMIDGSGTAMSSEQVKTFEAWTVPSCEVTKLYYDFVEWRGSDGKTYHAGDTIPARTFGTGNKLTLTAVFEPHEYGPGEIDSNIQITIPSSINFVVEPDGTLTGPSNVSIVNNSPFSARISSVDVNESGSFKFVANADDTDEPNAVELRFGPVIDMLSASSFLSKTSVGNQDVWEMDSSEGQNTVQLETEGKVAHVDTDITKLSKFGEVRWYVKAGE